MQAVPLYRFWQFGTTVRYLQDADDGRKIHGKGFILSNIESMFRRIDDLGLVVSRRAAKDLQDLYDDLKITPHDAKLDAAQSKKLNSTVKALRQTLEAELLGLSAYVVSDKRIDVERLVDDVPSLLAPGVFEGLTDICRLDLTESAKCIAFERSTAAAFHLMRATEEALRIYYCHFIRRNRLSPMMWGPMVKALRSHRRARVNEILHNNLDNIRVSFRNPTQHPDKIYDIQEAQDLWALAIEAINRIHRAIKSDSV